MAVGVRLVMGAVFILAAHDTRYPWAVRVFGIIALAAAAGLGVMGPQRLERMVQWWLGLLEDRAVLLRAGMACAVLLGAFFVYAGI